MKRFIEAPDGTMTRLADAPFDGPVVHVWTAFDESAWRACEITYNGRSEQWWLARDLDKEERTLQMLRIRQMRVNGRSADEICKLYNVMPWDPTETW